MSNTIFVYIDQFQGTAVSASWEALGAAKMLAGEMGGSVTALVLGSGVDEVAQQAFHYGADEVIVADDATLADYRMNPYATLISKAAADAEVLLFPTTSRGRELAGVVAIDLNSGVLTDVTSMAVEDGKVTAIKPVFAGKLLSKVVCNAKPQIITLRNRAFPKPEANPSASGTLTTLAPAIAEADITTKVDGYATSEGGVSLNDAGVIVSGGRGTSNNPALTPPDGMDDKEAEIWRAQEGFKLVGNLAAVLGGAVGASRAAVDAGYIPYKHQVGQTGKVVSPDLYIAAGISGAIQHLAGMRTSKNIVAINKDPDAPIFKLSRYGVVGDLFEILPALTEAFKTKLGK